MTLPDILQAGYRAEAEGRLDYAAQLYRHLVDYYGRSPEAGEARRALARLAQPAASEPSGESAQTYRSLSQALDVRPTSPSSPQPLLQPEALQPAVVTPPTSRRALASAPSSARQPVRELPAPANGYRLGRGLAVLLMVIGCALVGLGLLLLGYGAFYGLYRPTPAGIAPMVAAPGMIVSGLALTLIGQLFLAIFRTANATTNLVEIARARDGTSEG
jgi:hypothetical protein